MFKKFISAFLFNMHSLSEKLEKNTWKKALLLTLIFALCSLIFKYIMNDLETLKNFSNLYSFLMLLVATFIFLWIILGRIYLSLSFFITLAIFGFLYFGIYLSVEIPDKVYITDESGNKQLNIDVQNAEKIIRYNEAYINFFPYSSSSDYSVELDTFKVDLPISEIDEIVKGSLIPFGWRVHIFGIIQFLMVWLLILAIFYWLINRAIIYRERILLKNFFFDEDWGGVIISGNMEDKVYDVKAPLYDVSTAVTIKDLEDKISNEDEHTQNLFYHISSIIKHYNEKGTDHCLNKLNHVKEVLEEENDDRNERLGLITFAIPTIGFIGTVIGISESLGLVQVLFSSANIEDGIKLVSIKLGLAFDTTLIALIFSLIIAGLRNSLAKSFNTFYSDFSSLMYQWLVLPTKKEVKKNDLANTVKALSDVVAQLNKNINEE